MSKTLRVFLVDDNKKDALLLERAFQASGGVEIAHHAEGGDEAISRLQAAAAANPAELPDLILLDINMPTRDGFDVLRALKNDAALASVPVVILTTSQRDEDVRRSYSGGAAAFVPKPLTFEDLCELSRRFVAYWSDVAALPAR